MAHVAWQGEQLINMMNFDKNVALNFQKNILAIHIVLLPHTTTECVTNIILYNYMTTGE